MDSDFRLGLWSSFNNVKVKKDDSEQVIVEPTPTVEIVVSKKETISAPVKVEIVEKKEEIVGYLYGDPAALGMHIKSNHLISLGSISETNWNYDITPFTDSTTVAGYLKNKVLSVAKFIGLS